LTRKLSVRKGFFFVRQANTHRYGNQHVTTLKHNLYFRSLGVIANQSGATRYPPGRLDRMLRCPTAHPAGQKLGPISVPPRRCCQPRYNSTKPGSQRKTNAAEHATDRRKANRPQHRQACQVARTRWWQVHAPPMPGYIEKQQRFSAFCGTAKATTIKYRLRASRL
jgi:hypothetical protein